MFTIYYVKGMEFKGWDKNLRQEDSTLATYYSRWIHYVKDASRLIPEGPLRATQRCCVFVEYATGDGFLLFGRRKHRLSFSLVALPLEYAHNHTTVQDVVVSENAG